MKTYIIERRTMKSRLNNLNRSFVASFDGDVDRDRYLRQTHASWIRVAGRTDELEWRNHGKGHIGRNFSKAKIDVDESSCVTLKPAWLEGYSASFDGPFCSVGGCRHATTWRVSPCLIVS